MTALRWYDDAKGAGMAGGTRRLAKVSSARGSNGHKSQRRSEAATHPNGVTRAALASTRSGYTLEKQAKARAGRHADEALHLIDSIRKKMPNRLGKDVQTELGYLVRVLPDVGLVDDPRVVGQVGEVLREANLAVEALLSKPPNLELGRTLRKNVCRRLNPWNVILARILFPGEAASTWLAFGLAIIGILGIPAVALGYRWLASVAQLASLGIDPNVIMVVSIAGGLGAIVSVATRILKQPIKTDASPNNMFWTGLFKPLVGTIFALFVYVLLNSGLVPLQTVDVKKQTFFFAAVGFISGFSERLAPDLADAGAKALQPKA
jgi:hypothetical protein